MINIGRGAPAAAGGPSFFSQLKPVWVVDDDRSIRWVFEKALTREGIPFKTFALVQDALDALALSPPQVLVSDIRMPGATGLEVLKVIRSRRPHAKVLVITGHLTAEARAEFEALGQKEFISKPYTLDELGRCVRRLLDARGREVVVSEIAP